jgi:hypothetical protein
LVSTFDLYRTCMAKYVHCATALGPRSAGLPRQRRLMRVPREVA